MPHTVTPSAIRRLPRQVTQTVRSTTHATDLTEAASELVLNSLEAGSKSIKVTASPATWSLIVEDDGCGIPAASIPLLGERFCTSKSGLCRGEALASLAAISAEITIITRGAGTFETHRKRLVGPGDRAAPKHGAEAGITGQPVNGNKWASSLCPVPRQHHGTSVSLVGLLHNQPVRCSRLLQRHAAGGSEPGASQSSVQTSRYGAASAASVPHVRAATSMLQEMQEALFALVLPYTEVELIVQQAGSNQATLQMSQGRCLLACAEQLFQPQLDQYDQHPGGGHLQHIQLQHSADWNIMGTVLTATSSCGSKQQQQQQQPQQQLLYVNKRAAACPVLAQLLRDWFMKLVRVSAANAAQAKASGSCRAIEPGYVLLITCPETSYTASRQASSLTITADFTSSMHALCGLLEATLGPIWGSLPSAWSKVAVAAAAAGKGTAALQQFAGSEPSSAPIARLPGGATRRERHLSVHALETRDADKDFNCNSDTRQAGVLQAFISAQGHDTGFQACGRLPSHGLQITSNTRSLATIQAPCIVTASGQQLGSSLQAVPAADTLKPQQQQQQQRYEHLSSAAVLASEWPHLQPHANHSNHQHALRVKEAVLTGIWSEDLLATTNVTKHITSTLPRSYTDCILQRSNGSGSGGRVRNSTVAFHANSSGHGKRMSRTAAMHSGSGGGRKGVGSGAAAASLDNMSCHDWHVGSGFGSGKAISLQLSGEATTDPVTHLHPGQSMFDEVAGCGAEAAPTGSVGDALHRYSSAGCCRIEGFEGPSNSQHHRSISRAVAKSAEADGWDRVSGSTTVVTCDSPLAVLLGQQYSGSLLQLPLQPAHVDSSGVDVLGADVCNAGVPSGSSPSATLAGVNQMQPWPEPGSTHHSLSTSNSSCKLFVAEPGQGSQPLSTLLDVGGLNTATHGVNGISDCAGRNLQDFKSQIVNTAAFSPPQTVLQALSPTSIWIQQQASQQHRHQQQQQLLNVVPSGSCCLLPTSCQGRDVENVQAQQQQQQQTCLQPSCGWPSTISNSPQLWPQQHNQHQYKSHAASPTLMWLQEQGQGLQHREHMQQAQQQQMEWQQSPCLTDILAHSPSAGCKASPVLAGDVMPVGVAAVLPVSQHVAPDLTAPRDVTMTSPRAAHSTELFPSLASILDHSPLNCNKAVRSRYVHQSHEDSDAVPTSSVSLEAAGSCTQGKDDCLASAAAAAAATETQSVNTAAEASPCVIRWKPSGGQHTRHVGRPHKAGKERAACQRTLLTAHQSQVPVDAETSLTTPAHSASKPAPSAAMEVEGAATEGVADAEVAIETCNGRQTHSMHSSKQLDTTSARAALLNPHATPSSPLRMPALNLCLFSERLISSAPPAMKQRKIRARSGASVFEDAAASCRLPVDPTQRRDPGPSTAGAGAAMAPNGSPEDTIKCKPEPRVYAASVSLHEHIAAPAPSVLVTAAAAATECQAIHVDPLLAKTSPCEAEAVAQHDLQRRRRHTSPGVLQQHKHGHNQQQQKQQNEQQRQALVQLSRCKGLIQTRLPFKTVNGELPSTPKHVRLKEITQRGCVAGAQATRCRGPLQPAWEQNSCNPAGAATSEDVTQSSKGKRHASDPALGGTAKGKHTADSIKNALKPLCLDGVEAGHPSVASDCAEQAAAAAAMSSSSTAHDEKPFLKSALRSSSIKRSVEKPRATADHSTAAEAVCLDPLQEPSQHRQQQVDDRSQACRVSEQIHDPGQQQLECPAPARPRKRVRFSGIQCSQGGSGEDQHTAVAGNHPIALGTAAPVATQRGAVLDVQQQQQSFVASCNMHMESQPSNANHSTRSRFFSPSTGADVIHTHAVLPGRACVGELLWGAGPGMPQVRSGSSSCAVILALDELSGHNTCLLVPPGVTREQLQAGHVLGQADTKLVVLQCGQVLLALDQHAADERVQLELLQQRLAQQLTLAGLWSSGSSAAAGKVEAPAVRPDASPTMHGSSKHQTTAQGAVAAKSLLSAPGLLAVTSPDTQLMPDETHRVQPAEKTLLNASAAVPPPATYPSAVAPVTRGLPVSGNLLHHRVLQPPLHLELTMQGYRALELYKELVEAWGWRVAAAAAVARDTQPLVSGVPQPLLLHQVPVLAGVQLSSVDLQLYLHQLLDTAGSSRQPPPGVMRVLRSKACRGAIMFGDSLTQQQCRSLLEQLAATELCFMCAHGRPTTVPLVDLHQLKTRLHQWQQRQSLVRAAEEPSAALSPAALRHWLYKCLRATPTSAVCWDG